MRTEELRLISNAFIDALVLLDLDKDTHGMCMLNCGFSYDICAMDIIEE